jgi:hypothetical protein
MPALLTGHVHELEAMTVAAWYFILGERLPNGSGELLMRTLGGP